ncbi:diacylglycerol/lipid kinase family protein [Sutcliffiella rhizosphaerae]|uniref:Lipid kinase YtlR n=1 Tax=Sutcliffiella rhizosphaerae TaxID=2880967 RepID=A0ABM8YLI2_9BACI|nr:diacylglycerol kinase family protein [Sutcliffiella rhizosphaerae]CAG9620825.1 Putative lipid kinase YtlR [Sutcliffiella rhizosphaerae]
MYYFIVNKTSGNGKGYQSWLKVEEILKNMEIDFLVEFTEYVGHAKEIAEKQSFFQDAMAIVVIGGDGTIHEVVNALVLKDVPLAVIPAGTGNDYARSLHIPFNVEEALERVFKGIPTWIDTPKVDKEYFISIAGMGFDGKVAEVTNQSKSKNILNKIGLGNLVYIINIFKVLFTYQPTGVKITIDGKEIDFHDVWLIAIANLPYYGGGLKICPDARADDEKFDICIVSGISRWELLLVFPRVFRGSHITHRHVSMFKGETVLLAPNSNMILQCDGEIMVKEELFFSIEKKSLKIL